jgi:hypothetical protein
MHRCIEVGQFLQERVPLGLQTSGADLHLTAIEAVLDGPDDIPAALFHVRQAAL